MRLYLLPLLLCLFSHSVYAAPLKIDIPLYGEMTKTPDELAADQQFLADVLRLAGTKERATGQVLHDGWTAIKKNDLVTAIRRFNQAYLLAPNDYQVYWGLGTARAMQGYPEESVNLFERGNATKPQDSRYLCDYGFSIVNLALTKAQKENIDPRPNFKRAADLYKQAQKIAPKEALAYSRHAVIHYYLGDCAAAKSTVKKAKSLGGEGLDPRFEADLEKFCKAK